MEVAEGVTPSGSSVIEAGGTPEVTGPVDSRGGLFAPEAEFTPEQLMGEDIAEAGEASDESLSVEKDAGTPPLSDDEAAKEAQPAPDPEKKEVTPEIKPDDPIVKEVAKATAGIRNELVTERKAHRDVAAKLNDAQATIAELQAALAEQPTVSAAKSEEAEKWKDFKILSKEEFRDLCEDDLRAGQEYTHDLLEYKDYQLQGKEQSSRKALAERTRKQLSDATASVINESRMTMAEVVPGIFDDDNPISGNLIAFAEQRGMDKDLLIALSDPSTVFVERGTDGKYGKPRISGKGAAAIVKMIYSLYQETSPEGIAELKKQITSQAKEDATKELIGKFKPNVGFRDIGDAPAGKTTPSDTGQVLSEDDFRDLDDKAARAFLGG